VKFQRNARMVRVGLDAAPFAIVFFLLVIFLMLGSLVYTPGVRLDLPAAEGLPGMDRPPFAVAVDANGRVYFENQLIEEDQLRARLRQAARDSVEPPTLVVHADKAVTTEMLVRLVSLAREAGIQNALLATLPRPVALRPAPAP
jgi:biopolymer transport protein ExbD